MGTYTTLATWTPKTAIPQRPPHCAVCDSSYLRGGSFIFVGAQSLSVCKADAMRLHSLSPIEREEAIKQLVERHAPANHTWRLAA
jgi:hypothetical protein